MIQRGQQAFVHGHDRLAALCAPAVLGREAAALFSGIGQFVITVGQLHALPEEFEAFGHGRIAVADPGQGRLAGGPVVDEERRIGRQAGFDHVGEQQVSPGIRIVAEIGDIDAVFTRAGPVIGQRGREGIDAGPFDEDFPIGQSPGRLRWRCQHRSQQLFHFIHEPVMVPADAVPFEQGEFGIVPPPGFAGAEHPGQLPDVAAARGQQAFHGEFGRSVQIPRAIGRTGRDALDVRIGIGGGRQAGGFHLEHAARLEKGPDPVQEPGPKLQHGHRGRRPPVVHVTP